MIAFRSHKNGVTQNGLTPLVYNAVTMPSVDYDHGSRYANDAWTPVQSEEESRAVVFSGQIWIPYDGIAGLHLTGAENLVARIIKNGNVQTGVTIGTAIGSKGPFPEDWVIALSMQDIAQAGDTYRLYLFTYDPDAFIDGHRLHTFWCGAVIA